MFFIYLVNKFLHHSSFTQFAWAQKVVLKFGVLVLALCWYSKGCKFITFSGAATAPPFSFPFSPPSARDSSFQASADGPLFTIVTPCPDFPASNSCSGAFFILQAGIWPIFSSTKWKTSGLTYFELPISCFWARASRCWNSGFLNPFAGKGSADLLYGSGSTFLSFAANP